MVADLVAPGSQVLELAPGQLFLVEEAVGRVGSRQNVEGRGVSELGVLALECLHDADRAIGVEHPLAVLLDELELARRGIVEGQNDGRSATTDADPAVEDVVEGHQPVPPFPEPFEVTTEVGGRARPALLGKIDLVVLENHDAPELVWRKIAGRDHRGQERPGGKGDEAEETEHA